MKRKYLPLAAAGALISWMVFILGKAFWGNIFLPTLFASFVTDVYAEILARICKETSTSFFVTSIIPLIPGSTLYYCMNSILEGNTVQALEYGRDTFLFAFGIVPAYRQRRGHTAHHTFTLRYSALRAAHV